jgi:hypothetical protein
MYVHSLLYFNIGGYLHTVDFMKQLTLCKKLVLRSFGDIQVVDCRVGSVDVMSNSTICCVDIRTYLEPSNLISCTHGTIGKVSNVE